MIRTVNTRTTVSVDISSAVGSREAFNYLPIAKACVGTNVCFVFELLLGFAVGHKCALQVELLVNLCHYVHIVKVLITTCTTMGARRNISRGGQNRAD